MDSEYKSIQSRLKSLENQIENELKSIEIKLKSIEIMLQHFIQKPDHLNFHTIQAPKFPHYSGTKKLFGGGPPH